MKQTTFTILFLIAILISGNTYSQRLSDYTAGQLKSMGKNSLMYKDPYSAIDYFEAYLRKKKDDAEIIYQLAECYRNTRNYTEALELYKKAYKADPKKNLAAKYYQAKMLMTQKNYSEAYELLKKFKKEARDVKSVKVLYKLCSDQMSGCKTAMRDSGNVVWMAHVDSTINMPSAELSPILVDQNTMVYASLRTDTTVFTVDLDNDKNIPRRKFYEARRNGDNWRFIGEWDDIPFDNSRSHTGNGALSPDEKRFYFTRCEKNWKNEMICKIYQSKKDSKERWSKPRALPSNINNPKYTTTHPAVATYSKRNQEILYFVSDRPGGKGGTDIWYTRYKKRRNAWTEPRNCGGKINTEGNEVTPYIDMEDRTMYFSSDGWGGWGELDVFKAVGEMGKWMPNENIKTPINSPNDDLYYSLSKDQSEGFLVSNRPGGNNKEFATCCDDIYAFKYDEIIRVTTIGKIYARIDKKFRNFYKTNLGGDDSEGVLSVDSSFALAEGVVATLFLIDETAPMGAGNMVYVKNDSIDANGNFQFNLEAGKEYVIEVENYGYFNQRYNISTFLYKKSDTMYLDTIGIDIMPKDPIVVKNIYYESGEYELQRKARKSIDTTLLVLLQENSQIVIEISSHTDNKGRDKANVELSQKRAEGVVKYLMKRGIDRERLYAKGYGESRPIAPNELPNGKDNPKGRQMNRRTEFRIIGSLDQYTEIIFDDSEEDKD